MNYTAVILAGGKSKRFGVDKAGLDVNGVNLIEMIVEKCRSFFSEILIAGGNFYIPGTRYVSDIYENAGPLGGIHAGLTFAENEVCFAVACDMPNFSLPLAKRLFESAEGCDIVLPKTGDYIQPLYAVYKKSVLPVADRLLSGNEKAIRKLYDMVKVHYVEIPPNKDRPENSVFFNINYREDYELYKKAIPPVLSVVGFSNSGKTTYLEKLIPVLKKRNLKVGVIKHDAHSFDIDVPGKDSWRLTQAGADITIISSPGKVAVMEKKEQEEDLFTLSRRLKGKVDIILTEGYKRDRALKIEIRRSAKSLEPFCDDAEIFAIATDFATTENDLPLNDPEPMADLIIRFLERGGVK